MASSSDASKRVAYNIARHLLSQISAGILSEDEKEGLDVAVQCICQAYRLDMENEEQRKAYAMTSPLEDLVLGACAARNGGHGGASVMEVDDEDKATAEAYKQQGNVHLKATRYEEALDCYTKALTTDPNNPMCYCNRAATYIKLGKLDLADIDCKKSISLKPDYARAHGRLGFIYSLQDKLQLSKECFMKAISLDPENANYRENLQVVEERMSGSTTPQAPPQGQASGGGAAAAGGGAEGGPGGPVPPGLGFLGAGLTNLLQNPGFMNMATTLMQSPTFQNMATHMMSRNVATPDEVTPEVLSEVSEAARELHQNNPEVVESFQRQMFDVMSGASAQPGQQQQQDGQQQSAGNSENQSGGESQPTNDTETGTGPSDAKGD